MTKEYLDQLKNDNTVKFIYKLPCSFYAEGFEYIIIGKSIEENNNIKKMTIEQWFDLMDSGSLLPYVCGTSKKSNKIKEYLNIYQKPNILKTRSYINNIGFKTKDLIQECMWCEQIIKEGKINRIDVFKETKDPVYAMHKFYDAVNPIYKNKINE